MTTLFSPIGTADPITSLGDGPMLHIVRHCKPDKIVLFLSPKMQKYQRLDERYTIAIEKLCASEGNSLPLIQLEESLYDNVHKFDYYIGEFEQVLEKLCGDSSDEPVLVNTSSGTPAMQQALVALGSFGRLNLKMLQVPTPRRDTNRPEDRESLDSYDLEELWAWNEELRSSDPDALESRVMEVATPNFAGRLIRENVVTLLGGFGYEGAFELASIARGVSEEAKEMIRAAADRINLDSSSGRPAKAFAGTRVAYRPNDLLGEYLSVMEVRLEQGHWADFVRMLSPALTQIERTVLKENGLPEHSYLLMDGGKPTDELNWDAIERDEVLNRLFAPLKRKNARYIESWILSNMVEQYCEDENVKEKTRNLRNVESKCRNILAHKVTSSSKETLERLGGLSLEDVLKYLFDLHGNVRPHLYQGINELIIELL